MAASVAAVGKRPMGFVPPPAPPRRKNAERETYEMVSSTELRRLREAAAKSKIREESGPSLGSFIVGGVIGYALGSDE